MSKHICGHDCCGQAVKYVMHLKPKQKYISHFEQCRFLKPEGGLTGLYLNTQDEKNKYTFKRRIHFGMKYS